MLSALAANAAAGDTFYCDVWLPYRGYYKMMFTDLGDGKAALGNGYSACMDYRYDGEVEIPQQLWGGQYTVTEINKFAFYLCNNIKKLTLPASIQKIDDFAFYGCRALVETNSKTTATETTPTVQAVRNGAFSYTGITHFWVEDASQCDKRMFNECNDLKWVVLGGTDSGKTFADYDRTNADSRTYGMAKGAVVYLPKGVAWTKAYDASRTSLTPTDDDWTNANYVYYNSNGERESQFAAFGYNVPRLAISNDTLSSMDLPLDFTASLAYISRGASTADVQTIYVPMEVPMGRYNTDETYKNSRAYVYSSYETENGGVSKVIFQRTSSLPANTGGLLVDFSNDILANTNVHVSAFGPSSTNTNPAVGEWIGYYDRQAVPAYSWAFSGSLANKDANGKEIPLGTFFQVASGSTTYSAPMRAVLWLGEVESSSSSAKAGIPAVFIDDGGTTTLIRGIADHEAADNLWYTLGGVRLTSKPVAKGVYVHGGQKVIVK